MTKLLNEVLRMVADLPEARQDDAAHVLLSLLENDEPGYRLSDDQLHEVELAVREADRGDLATDADVSRMLHQSWA